VIDNGAVIEQQLHQLRLHAGASRMNAGGHQAESCGAATVHIRFFIDFRAGIQQNLCNLNDVGRCLLAISLHAIGRNVMQKRGVVFTRRAGALEFWILAQQPLQFGCVSGDDRVCRRFKSAGASTFAMQRRYMLRELRPAGKALAARNGELGVSGPDAPVARV